MHFKHLKDYTIKIVAVPNEAPTQAYILLECPLNDFGALLMRFIKDKVAEGCYILDKKEHDNKKTN